MTTKEPSLGELKPCPVPWCVGKHGEPYVFERRFDCIGVYCPSCCVTTDYHRSEEAAIAQWNTRANTPEHNQEDGG